MPNHYDSQGVSFDDLFDPYVSGDTNFAYSLQDDNGNPICYAPLNVGSKQRDVGYVDANGTDYSWYWAAKGTAQYSLPVNGRSYSAHNQAKTNSTGSTTATVRFTAYSNGTYEIVSSQTGGGNNSSTVRDSGTWLRAGDSASNYELSAQVVITSGGASGSGSGWGTDAQGSVYISVTSASAEYKTGRGDIYLRIRNKNSGSVNETKITGTVTSSGWY